MCVCIYIKIYIYEEIKQQKILTFNFLPLGIMKVLVGLQKDEISTWCFLPARGKLVFEQQKGPFILEGLLLPPETHCPLLLVNSAKDRAEMLQPRQVGRGDLSNHTNDFFPSP